MHGVAFQFSVGVHTIFNTNGGIEYKVFVSSENLNGTNDNGALRWLLHELHLT